MKLEELQERIGVRFTNFELLVQAMTHASKNYEKPQSHLDKDNERLEYLGDAVLQLVSAEHLFQRYPNSNEGKLTQGRIALVNTKSLSELGKRISLDETLLISKGLKKNGGLATSPSLMANAFEALIGAIYLDQGIVAASKVFHQAISLGEKFQDENFKGKLQVQIQKEYREIPQYRVVASRLKEQGGKEFTVEVFARGRFLGRGQGPSKRDAEHMAAKEALTAYAKRMIDPAFSKAAELGDS